MKTLLYMAQSANGCVADHKGGTPWSDGGWKKFRKAIKSAGNLVIGRRTYDIMCREGSLDLIGRPYTVVVSRQLKMKPMKNRAVVRSPKEVLKHLRDAGYKTVLIAGGTKLNSSFIEQKLVDEIVLDVEPLLFGDGLPLLESRPLVQELKLIAARKYRGGFSLRYKILK
jgi:dihydrofolate reductase